MATDSSKTARVAWAQQWRDENLSEYDRQLIAQANYDLWYGPCQEDGYPGFTAACEHIKQALVDVPSQMYFSTECDDWCETEPTALGTCYACDGDGLCAVCNGTGEVEYPCAEDWTLLNRPALINALVGRELGEYVR